MKSMEAKEDIILQGLQPVASIPDRIKALYTCRLSTREIAQVLRVTPVELHGQLDPESTTELDNHAWKRLDDLRFAMWQLAIVEKIPVYRAATYLLSRSCIPPCQDQRPIDLLSTHPNEILFESIQAFSASELERQFQEEI